MKKFKSPNYTLILTNLDQTHRDLNLGVQFFYYHSNGGNFGTKIMGGGRSMILITFCTSTHTTVQRYSISSFVVWGIHKLS